MNASPLVRESHLLEHATRDRPTPDHVIVPSGDDLAGVTTAGAVLTGVDQLVAGRHFDPATASLDEIGWKAVARCVSDIAAMAGSPLATLAAVVLPCDWSETRAKGLFDAVDLAARRLDAPLVGGDIAIHPANDGPLTLSITVLAAPGPAGPVRRGGARDGDRIVVTGRFGGSLEPDGRGRHLRPEPRVGVALALASTLGDDLHAAIDVSDGLGRDAARIASASGLDLELEADRIPCHDGLNWRRAVGDGEDYELILAVDAHADVPASVDGVALTEIGRARDRGDGGRAWVLRAHDRVDVSESGWDHTGSAAQDPHS